MKLIHIRTVFLIQKFCNFMCGFSIMWCITNDVPLTEFPLILVAHKLLRFRHQQQHILSQEIKCITTNLYSHILLACLYLVVFKYYPVKAVCFPLGWEINIKYLLPHT